MFTAVLYIGTNSIVNITDGCKVVYNRFLEYNENVTSIILPDSIESINTNAFKGCINLSEIVLPDKNIYLGECNIKDTKLYNDAPDNVLFYINTTLLFLKVEINIADIR